MATPFKLKSVNTSAFKNLGSSPVKQDLPKDFNVKGSKGSTTPGYSTTKAAKVAKEAKDYTTVRKELSKKISGKNMKVDLETAKKSSSKLPKNFNTKGSSKAGRFAKVTKKVLSTNLKSAGKQAAQATFKEATKKGLGKVITKVATRGAGRVLGGPAGLVAGLAYGAYKSGRKHSDGKAVKNQKSFMADAKKNTKSIYKKK